MANAEQTLQDWDGESPASTSFGVDTTVVPALTADEGGETPSSEYSLYFKRTLVRQGYGGGLSCGVSVGLLIAAGSHANRAIDNAGHLSIWPAWARLLPPLAGESSYFIYPSTLDVVHHATSPITPHFYTTKEVQKQGLTV